MPTLQEFHNSRVTIEDLGALTSCPEDDGVRAYMYLDTVFIAIQHPHCDKEFYLPLESSEFCSDDLTVLEAELFDYVKDALIT